MRDVSRALQAAIAEMTVTAKVMAPTVIGMAPSRRRNGGEERRQQRRHHRAEFWAIAIAVTRVRAGNNSG